MTLISRPGGRLGSRIADLRLDNVQKIANRGRGFLRFDTTTATFVPLHETVNPTPQADPGDCVWQV
jgi:hypothetical protein